ncbi:MAG: AAA family ATPase [Steroidobacteraceae bacterium]
MTFIGRKNELDRLDRFERSPQSRIAVMYGRRRIGKSALIQEALQNRAPLFFEALEERPKRDQLNHFMLQLQHLTGHPGGKPRRWTEALLELYGVVEENPRPIVFDEFQWMANYRHELVSELKYVWDRFFSKLPGQKLILCGSIASFMVEKVVKSSALYGRIEAELEVPAFKLPETQQMLPGKGFDEVLQAHMLTGGVPKYLELLRDYPSVHLAMQDLAFKPDGYFTTEYQRIFISHFGKNPAFEAVIRALAAHPLGLMREELARMAKVTLGGRLSEHLRDLESAGFLSADTPFHRGLESRQIKYFLCDAYLRFYFAFIHPNLKKIRSGQGANILAGISGSGALHAWMGRSFEYSCLQHAAEISRIVGFSAVDFTMGPYFSPARRGSAGVQIDLVFDRADSVLTVCEMKYSANTVGVEVIASMKRKIELLQPVARGKTVQPVLVVRDRPSQQLLDQGYFYKVIEAREFLKGID